MMSLCKSVILAVKQHASGKSSGYLTIRNKDKFKEVQVNAQNLSTQKASEKERARLQKENGNC